jgi:hypothetical protein
MKAKMRVGVKAALIGAIALISVTIVTEVFKLFKKEDTSKSVGSNIPKTFTQTAYDSSKIISNSSSFNLNQTTYSGISIDQSKSKNANVQIGNDNTNK